MRRAHEFETGANWGKVMRMRSDWTDLDSRCVCSYADRVLS